MHKCVCAYVCMGSWERKQGERGRERDGEREND